MCVCVCVCVCVFIINTKMILIRKSSIYENEEQ